MFYKGKEEKNPYPKRRNGKKAISKRKNGKKAIPQAEVEWKKSHSSCTSIIMVIE